MSGSEGKKIDWRAVAHKVHETVDEEVGDGEGIGEDGVAETLEGFDASEHAEIDPSQEDGFFVPQKPPVEFYEQPYVPPAQEKTEPKPEKPVRKTSSKGGMKGIFDEE